MRSVKLLVVLLFIIACVTAAYSEEPAKGKTTAADKSAITAVVKAQVTKEVVESVYVEKVVGDYAMAIVSVKDGDGGTAFLRRDKDGWKLLNYGDAVTEAALVGFGIPTEVAKKLAD